jgi:hypothetical protein
MADLGKRLGTELSDRHRVDIGRSVDDVDPADGLEQHRPVPKASGG